MHLFYSFLNLLNKIEIRLFFKFLATQSAWGLLLQGLADAVI